MSQNDDLNHASILNLTAQEKTAYSYLFSLADSDSLNVVTGERAVSFFEKTSVPAPVLGEAWQIADTENRGLLTKPGFCMVLRLIGWYQNGQHSPSTELAFKPAPIPKFEGVTIPGVNSGGAGNVAAASPTSGSFPQGALQPQLSGQNTGSTPVRVPPLGPTKVQQYSNLFNHSNTTNGLLDGGTAKSIFERAGLPNDVLGRIWMLSDREQRGALDETEFIIAMHLLTCMKMRTIPNLPNTLPQGLYDAAARRGQRPSSRQNTQQAAAVPRQLTGSGVGTVPRTQSPLARPPSSNYSAPTPQLQSAQPTGQNWLITPQEKAQYDNHFNNIDTAGAGVLSGEQAVQFFSDSRLSEDTLASIWDLADINSEGQLNRDEFAVAMYLIRQQRSPNPPPLPAFLPAALVPPSMRGPQQVQQSPAFAQQQQPQQSAFDAPTPTPIKPVSASDDLFGLDSSPTQPHLPQQQTLQPQGTGASATRDPFAGSAQGSPASPTRFQQQQSASGTFKPFIPTSAFGASLAAQNTGSSTTSQPQQQPRGPKAPMPSVMDDLLGDNDASAEESRGIGSDSTELANMSNQIGNLRTQMESTQSKKAATQADLTATSNQKRDLEQRLQQFRAQYEAEVRTVKEMEQQLATSKASTKQLGQELAMLEGTHQDLQTQHNSIGQALQADQQENANLKQRIAQINSEVSGLKPQIEKLKLDARQQKGLVSINKKQLATNEAERDRMVSDKADLERAATASAAAAEEHSRSLAASPVPAVGSNVASAVTSPAAAAASSTNPFFRSTSQGSSGSPPPAAGPNPASFDAIFGPSNAFAPTGQTNSRSGTPPATSFIGRSVPDTSTATSTIAAVGAGAAALGAAAVGGVVAAVTGGDSGSSSGQATPPPSSDIAKESPLTASEPPPPPPESRQFTPTELPIGGGVVGAESDTASSTKVIPPASRAGGIETPRELASSPPSILGSAGGATSAFSPPPPATSEEPEREIVPGAFPAEERRPSIVAQEVSSSNPPSTRDVTPLPQPKPADDFESAFASFGESDKTKEAAVGTDPFAPTSSSQQGASKVGDAEFPPIQNLEQDDDSDSDSEDERGFDDDFTTASPPRNGVEGASGAVATPLPDATQQTSPPSYEQSAGSAAETGAASGDSSSFPREFGSLLPAREDPTSPPPPADNQAAAGPPDEITPAPLPSETQSPSQTVESSSDTFVDASSRPLSSIPDTTTVTQTAPAAATSAPKNVFDEFDDFGDLSEARDAGTTGNDLDFAFGRASQEEYNPTFDSPAASQTPTPLKSNVLPAPTQESNGFANFTPNTSTVGTSPFGGGTGSVQRTPQDVQHDWDSIFSGLDNSNNVDTSLSSSSVPDASADEIWQPPPGPPPGRAPITTNGSSAPLAAPVPQSGTTTKGAPTGRAITPGTEHDDPILKRLTGMGYARADALNALEKYDYDINKAVDHLAGS